MLPGEVTSDLDGDDRSHDFYAGKWAVFVDLYGEFQGAFGAFLLISFLVPGIMVAAVVLEWTAHPTRVLLVAGLVFVVCVTVSLYALIWYYWVKKRMRTAYELMVRKGEEEHLGGGLPPTDTSGI